MGEGSVVRGGESGEQLAGNVCGCMYVCVVMCRGGGE